MFAPEICVLSAQTQCRSKRSYNQASATASVACLLAGCFVREASDAAGVAAKRCGSCDVCCNGVRCVPDSATDVYARADTVPNH